MSHPAVIAQRHCYAALAPGGALDALLAAAGVAGVWPDAVPAGQDWRTAAGAPRLHVVYGEQAPGDDLYVVGAVRLVTDPLIRVTVVGRVPSLDALEPAAARVDALLHDTTATVTGGAVDACVRERPLALGPLYGPGGETTYQLGGLYRLVIRET